MIKNINKKCEIVSINRIRKKLQNVPKRKTVKKIGEHKVLAKDPSKKKKLKLNLDGCSLNRQQSLLKEV